MSWMQIALACTVLMVAFVYLGGARFSPKLVRNIAGGLGVLAGLSWHRALGLADGSLVYKIAFVVAGYAVAVWVMRLRGVES